MAKHYATLEQESLLHLAGPDAVTFLQGQVTCDAQQVDASNARPGAYCTPKGRVVCDFLLCQLEEQHLALRLRRDLRKPSAGVFGKYIIFSKAELDPDNDDWALFGCWGDSVDASLRDIFGHTPDAQYAAIHGDGFYLVQTDTQGERFECYLHRSRQPALIQDLQASLEQAPEAAWQSLEIDAGLARVQAATSEEFVPQMLNFDLTGHVNFNKGCYTGQEVVARLHYRGVPKRRLYRVALPAGADVTPGDALFGGGEQSVGNLVNLADTEGQPQRALVVATVEKLDEGLHLQAASGPALELLDLPYPLETA